MGSIHALYDISGQLNLYYNSGKCSKYYNFQFDQFNKSKIIKLLVQNFDAFEFNS